MGRGGGEAIAAGDGGRAMTTSKSPVDDALHEPVEERVGAIEARDLQVAAPIDHLCAEHASAAFFYCLSLYFFGMESMSITRHAM